MADMNLGLVLLDKNKYYSMVLDQLKLGGVFAEQIFLHNRICAKVRRLMKSSPFSATTNQVYITEAENSPHHVILHSAEYTQRNFERPPNHSPILICFECRSSQVIHVI